MKMPYLESELILLVKSPAMNPLMTKIFFLVNRRPEIGHLTVENRLYWPFYSSNKKIR